MERVEIWGFCPAIENKAGNDGEQKLPTEIVFPFEIVCGVRVWQ